MSPLVTRPSLPEPGTVAASMPLSVASLRTEGASGPSAPADGLAGGGEAVGAGDGAGFSAAGAGAFAAAGAPAPSLLWQSRAPTGTGSPVVACVSLSEP